MQKWLIIYQVLFFCFLSYAYGLSIYSWTLTGRLYCQDNATQAQTQALFKCDNLMRPERKKLLTICLKEVMGYTLTDNKPTICSYYQNEKEFKVMDCMFSKLGQIYGKKYMANAADEDFDAIDAVENDFEWCVMKVGSVYGFEHLCDKQLTDKQVGEVEACAKNATELLKVLNDCRTESKVKIGSKPATCDFYGNIKVMNCYNKVSLKWTESDQNEKWNQYIECLADVPK